MGENCNLCDTDNHIQEYGLSFKSLYLLYSSNRMFCKFLHRSLPYLLLIYLFTFFVFIAITKGVFFSHYILCMACGNTAIADLVSTNLKNSVVTSISLSVVYTEKNLRELCHLQIKIVLPLLDFLPLSLLR